MSEKRGNFAPYILVVIISAVIGYFVHNYLSKSAIKEAAEKADVVLDSAIDLIDKQTTQWLKDITADSQPNPNTYYQQVVEVHEGSIVNLDSYSFGEQALLTKAFSSTVPVSDFVAASSDIPKAFIANGTNGSYVFSVAQKSNGTHLLLTRTSLKKLQKQLSRLNNDYIAIQVGTQNAKKSAIFDSKAYSEIGNSKPLKQHNNWQVKSSYQAKPTGISPQIIAGGLSGIVFLLGSLLTFLLTKKSRKKLASHEVVNNESNKTLIKTNSQPQLIDTSNLPLTPVADTSDISNSTTMDESTDSSDSDIQKTQKDAITNHDSNHGSDTLAKTDDLDGLDSLDNLESEIKSTDSDIAPYLPTQNEDKNPEVDLQSDDNVMEFSSPFTDEELQFSSETVEHKGQLADEELDDGNIILFENSSMDVIPQKSVANNSRTSEGSDVVGFRTFDVRADAKLLDDNFIKRFAYAFAKSIPERSQVVVARDTRTSGERIKQTLLGVLTNLNVKVIDLGVATTPMLAFAAKSYDGHGIMVTASHCATSDNGFKWFIKNLSPNIDDVQDLKSKAQAISSQEIQKLSTQVNQSSLVELSVADTYMSRLDDDIMMVNPLSVCIDCMHGASSGIVQKIMDNAGVEAQIINDNTDGNFSTGNPNPYEKNRLEMLRQLVLEKNANLGLAFDADGDRLAVVDDKGRILSSETLLAILAKFVLETHQSSNIIYDVKCSKATATNISASDGIPIMLPTGSNLMRRLLLTKKSDAIFAGEFSGHFIFNDGRFMCHDDAIYASLRLMEYLSQMDIILSEIVDEMVHHIGTEDIYYAMDTSDTDCSNVLTSISNYWQDNFSGIEQLRDFKVSEIDGFRVESANAFGLIRASNTADALTLRFAGKDQKHLEHILAVFVKLTESIDARLADTIKNLK